MLFAFFIAGEPYLYPQYAEASSPEAARQKIAAAECLPEEHLKYLGRVVSREPSEILFTDRVIIETDEGSLVALLGQMRA